MSRRSRDAAVCSFVCGLFSSFLAAPAPAQIGPGPCAGDVNRDGIVSLGDAAVVIAHWGEAVPPGTLGDADGSGVVGLGDIARIIAGWGHACATCFDIRAQIPGSAGDPPDVQDVYDSINLTMALIADDTFNQIFASTVSEFVQRAVPARTQSAADCGIITPGERDLLEAHLLQLESLAGFMTIRQLELLPLGSHPAVEIELVQLQLVGFAVPTPPATPAEQAARAAAIDRLVALAGTMRARDVQLLAADAVVPSVLAAVRDAELAQVWKPKKNKKCCNIISLCEERPNMYCARAWLSGSCNMLSEDCN